MPTNPAVRKAIADLVESLGALGNDSLDALTRAARDAIPGTDYASINVVREDGSVETLAPTDPIVVTIDQLQAELGEGPCFDAATNEAMFVAEDLAHDQRWLSWGPKAAALGIAAQMGVDLQHPGSGRAALNLYARRTWPFADSAETAELFASHAALALGYARATDRLQAALGSRKTIGQALGILMERYQIGEDRAFRFLVRVSQNSDVKVREVAADLVAELNDRDQSEASGD